ncbi:MAG: hypothetical protein ACRDO2_06260 [Nocardioidaceae bacterium]
MRHSHARTLIVGGAVLALGIGGGVAIADIPSSNDQTITACMTKPGGTIRLIDSESGATCKKSEQVVTWNTEGQPGADGVSGYEIVTNDKIPGVGFLGEGAFCPKGKKVVGGGASPIDENGNEVTLNVFNMLDSHPVNDGTAWSVSWTLTSNAFANDVRVHAICVTALP